MVKTLRSQILPVIAVRGIVIYPAMILHFDVARKKSISALEAAMANGQEIFLVSQKDLSVEIPDKDDLYKVGTVAKIKQLLKLPGNTVRVLVEGVYRAKISEFIKTSPHDECECVEVASKNKRVAKTEIDAIRRKIFDICLDMHQFNPKFSPDLLANIENMADLGQYVDSIASTYLRKVEDRQQILEELNTYERLLKLLSILSGELEILETEQDIMRKVRKQIDKNQKDYYLREQVKVLSKELGNDENEIEEYREKIENSAMGDEMRQKALKELSRLEKFGSSSSEAGVIRGYLDYVLDMPFGILTKESDSIKRAERILNRDHFGLSKVKKRILEYLSVKILSGSLGGQILCLAGPPGVGKTSIAKSIAEALSRKYVRISLGGIRDEAEIRGHRKTYLGAMPGRIAAGLKTAGSMNPLFLLDEIDKLTRDSHGDPSSALLEVLDSEQNFAFRDHYLEVPLDLSKVMFLTTANNIENIPRPLLDRMEIIELPGYTPNEKEEIAMRHLIPDALMRHGLSKDTLKISKSAARELILNYTREAGVRNLKREIDGICRKAATHFVADKKAISVTAKNLPEYAGKPHFRFETRALEQPCGVVRGLAWTAVGGDTLSIEVNVLPGSGKLELTGNLGDVMKESAKAAITFIRSRSESLGIDTEFYKNSDIHIHVPEGATPKDGPSAGITICTALLSALSKKSVPSDVAMTGEITITGRVLPVGGILEKVLAAYRYGVTKIFLPHKNRDDLDDVPNEVKEKIKFIFAEKADDVISEIF